MNSAQAQLPGPPAEVLCACAGLQLLPENAAHLQLLKRAAARAAATSPAEGGETNAPTPGALGDWVDSQSEGTQLPLPGLHCAEVVLATGGYRIFPGAYEDEYWVLELLLGISLEDSELPTTFVEEARAIGLTALILSEAIANRAGVQRNTEPEHRLEEGVFLPHPGELSELIRSVAFSGTDLEHLAGEDWRPILAAVTTSSSDLASGDDASAILRRTPLVEHDGGLIVAAPDAIAMAIRHRIVVLALQYDCRDRLAENFLHVVTGTVMDSLGRLGLIYHRPAPADDDPAFDRAEMLVLSDLDKEIHLLVLADDLLGYETDDPLHPWEGDPKPEVLEQRLHDVAIEELSRPAGEAPNELLHLVIAQGMGRPIERVVRHGLELRDRRVVLSASELDAIARCEDADVTLFTRFAAAAEEIRMHVALVPVSQLEEWAYWRRNRRSFSPLVMTLSGQGTGALIGMARMMRIEFGLNHDPHAAHLPDGGHARVLRYLEDQRAPLVQRDASPIGTADVLVEGLPLAVWVVPGEDLESGDLSGYLIWTEMIAYWLWQFASSTAALWEKLADLEAIAIEVLLTDETHEGNVGRPWRIVVKKGRQPCVRLAADAMNAFAGEDNRAERELMGGVLDVLNGLARSIPDAGEAPLSNEEIKACLERHMSPPGKRKLVGIVDVDPGYSRPAFAERQVSVSDEMELRAEVGHAAGESLGLGPGPVPEDRVHDTLNAVVDQLYGRLSALAASLQPHGVLEWVISLNERLLHEQTIVSGQLAVARAAFGADSPFALQKAETAHSGQAAAVASRFLIEYLGAAPPTGIRPMSYAAYDRLLAAAMLITRFGVSSDLVNEGIADVSVTIVPTGEAVDERGMFRFGEERFFEAARVGESLRAEEWMRERPGLEAARQAAEEEPNFEPDAAMLAETGHRLSDLVRVLIELTNTSGPGGGATVMGTSEAIGQLRGALGWDEQTALSALDYFTLGPRADFINPPPGYERRDLWPWRFNRRLSYLRRPLIRREDPEHPDDPELVFGMRQLFNSSLYLAMLISHGSLEATSKEMLDYMSRVQQRESDAFNDQVSHLYRTDWRVVRTRFEKVAGERLRGPDGNDLGDVDVLVADLPSCTLLCVEAKRLAGALAPHQLRNQLDATFQPGEGKKRSHAERHLRRAARVRELTDGVLMELGLADADPRQWTVDAVLVTDIEVLAAFVSEAPLSVRTFDQLKQALARGELY